MWGETTIEKKFRMAPSLEPPLLGSVKARRSWHPQARLHASDVVFRQTCTCLLFSIFERFFQEIRDHSFFDVIVQKNTSTQSWTCTATSQEYDFPSLLLFVSLEEKQLFMRLKLSKIGKIIQNISKYQQVQYMRLRDDCARSSYFTFYPGNDPVTFTLELQILGFFFAKLRSFSAVSAPIFASK